MKKVSIIVPCFNVGDYLPVCMEHLIQQTIGLEAMEIILVDDASTDDGITWKCIKEYEAKFPDTIIAVHLNENMRQGGARNIGISYAGGEYLLFGDADDWLAVEAAERLYSVAKEHDADIVQFEMKNVKKQYAEKHAISHGSKSELIIVDTEEDRKRNLIYDYIHFRFGFITKLYRSSLIKENQIAFAEHLICEEPAFTVPVMLYEKRHYFLDEVLYFCYPHLGSTITGNWDDHKWDNAKVWLSLVQDVTERGFLESYYSEIEFLFAIWCLGLSLRMWCQKGYYVQADEVKVLQKTVLTMFPGVVKNQYFGKNINLWDTFVWKVLQIEVSEESVAAVNQILRDELWEGNRLRRRKI